MVRVDRAYGARNCDGERRDLRVGHAEELPEARDVEEALVRDDPPYRAVDVLLDRVQGQDVAQGWRRRGVRGVHERGAEHDEVRFARRDERDVFSRRAVAHAVARGHAQPAAQRAVVFVVAHGLGLARRRDGADGEPATHEPRRERHARHHERRARDESALAQVREREGQAAVEVLDEPRLEADAPVHRENDVHAVHQRDHRQLRHECRVAVEPDAARADVESVQQLLHVAKVAENELDLAETPVAPDEERDQPRRERFADARTRERGA